jgi:uncharacterized phosphosugar-binding protein
MTAIVSIADAYLADLSARIAALRSGAADALARTVDAFVGAIERDGLIYIFGSGHSHMLAEEAHYRAGGIAATVPVLAAATMLHEGAVSGTRLERLPGLVAPILERYDIGPADVLVVVSNSGVNAAPVEAADYGKMRGATVVAITSEAYSRQAAAGRRRLADIADIVLDNGAPPGDAVMPVAGSPLRVGPVSTAIGVALLNAALAETAARLAASGRDAPIYLSANMPGASDVNAALVARYAPRNPHL